MSREGDSSSLLFEILIVLFFFALSSTVMIGMFTKAHDMSVKSRTTNQIVFVAQDWAEQLRMEEDPISYLKEAGFKEADSMYTLTTDDGLEISIGLTDEERVAGSLWSANIAVNNARDVTTQLAAMWYSPKLYQAKGAA